MSAKVITKLKNQKITGVAASGGIAAGKAYIYRRVSFSLDGRKIRDNQVSDEIKKFRESCEQVEQDLTKIAALAKIELGSGSSDIITSHIQILHDPELIKSVEHKIRQNHAADTAVFESFELFLKMMRASGNSLLMERVSDISDVRDRLIHRIQQTGLETEPVSGCILFTDDLTSTELVDMVRAGVKGIVLSSGGKTSHASIIARSMEIPMVAATLLAAQDTNNDDFVIVDGTDGVVYVNPGDEILSEYDKREKKEIQHLDHIRNFSRIAAVTSCGTEIFLRANIEFPDELNNLTRFGSKGIGLLRTESFFMNHQGSGEYSEETFYEQAVQMSIGNPVTIRLYDVGGDKVIESRTHEANPFLGWRGARILLDKRELLREQLRQILVVAGRYPGVVKILVPMITFIEEYREIKREVVFIQNELMENGFEIDPQIPTGIMVEVPAVVMQIDHFVKEVDFFSIGTNDLTQYTLAVDRGNSAISGMYRHLHPSVLKMIQITVDAANAVGKPVAVCGEAASDPVAALIFAGMGITDLSMTPSAIPNVKDAIIASKLEELKRLTKRALAACDEEEVRQIYS